MRAAIVMVIALIAAGGTAALVVLGTRVREEIRRLVRAFDHADRALVPLVAAVRSDRDRLVAHAAPLTDAGSRSAPTGR
jgi:hypothetical protein